MAKDYLTDSEYVARGGSVCPVCKSDNVSGGPLESDGGGSAYASCVCEACGAEWTDYYRLIGYSDLVDPSDLC